MTLAEILADLTELYADPARPLFTVTQRTGGADQFGGRTRALAFASPESAWRTYAAARQLYPECVIELSRRGNVICRHAPAEVKP